MKLSLLILSLMLSQFTWSQSLKDKQVKKEMLDRVDSLMQKVSDARDALDEEDAKSACLKIEEIFKILPDHLVAIGTKMDIFDSEVIRMEKETKLFLIESHQRKNICNHGTYGESLDLKDTDKKLKAMRKRFEKHKKKIKKSDTNFDNTYNYYYEF